MEDLAMRNLNLPSLLLVIFLSSCAGELAPKQTDTLRPLDDSGPPAPQTISIKIKNYIPQPGYVFKDVFVRNYSVVNRKNAIHFSNSRDGMSDELKLTLKPQYGFRTNGPQSRSGAPSFSDLVLWLAGIKFPQQKLLYCAPAQQLSTTNDALIYADAFSGEQVYLGLRDCEKIYLGLDPRKYDYDKDGIPDYLELRCGLNPHNPNDAAVSPAADGISNIEKCKRNIPVDESAETDANQKFSYKYFIELKQGGERDLTISNIPVLNDGYQNFMAFYFTESSTNGPGTALYSAYSILGSGLVDNTFEFPYWGAVKNQEILAP
jgi:hypothetical protein